MTNVLSYQDALKQLQKFTAGPLPTDVQCTALKSMEKELSKPETTQSILREVKHLMEKVIKIDQAFERVKTEVERIDGMPFIGKPVEKFRPRWIGLQRRFVVLLWESRQTVRQTAAYVKEFVGVILPELEDIQNQADFRVAAADLKEFIRRPNPFGGKLDSKEAGNKGRKCSHAFTDLRRDIGRFRANFDLFADDQGVDPHEDILRLREEISRLNIEIERGDMMVRSMGVALGASTSSADASSVASLAALNLLAPATTLKVFLAGAAPALMGLRGLVAHVAKTSGEVIHVSSQQASKMTRIEPQEIKSLYPGLTWN
ncbi:hypothetical protein DXG03_002734 [Asterophora parasitica]|uniref:Uncharacterized protein n=1 Tax=Asterophora parasitica TaxID=117018 RepID=A0A9P7G441_9AGAR|nr:hypothetical protein DXG03_002734 [Asterophora parasitica]